MVASFTSSNANYANAQSAAVTFTIDKATPTVTASDAGGTYNGNAFPAAATVNGAGSLEGVSPTLTYYSGTYTDPSELAYATALGAIPSAAGNYTVSAYFAGSAHYSSASALANFTIAQATPTVTVSDAGGVYTGQPFTATATVNGQNSLQGVTPTLTYYSGTHTLADLPLLYVDMEFEPTIDQNQNQKYPTKH